MLVRQHCQSAELGDTNRPIVAAPIRASKRVAMSEVEQKECRGPPTIETTAAACGVKSALAQPRFEPAKYEHQHFHPTCTRRLIVVGIGRLSTHKETAARSRARILRPWCYIRLG